MDFQNDLEKYSSSLSEKPKEVKYTAADTVFAILSFIFGFLFIKWIVFPWESIGHEGTILVIVFSAMSAIYLRLKGLSLKKTHVASLVGIDLMSTSYLLFANDTVKTFVTLFIILAFAYWFYTACGNRREEKIGDMLPIELFASLLIIPFNSFGRIFTATKNGVRSSSVAKKIGMILVGILIAVIPTAIVTALLLSADGAFCKLVDNLFSDAFINIPKNIWHFILGIPVAMYIFGMIYTNSERRVEEYASREKTELALGKARIAPATIVCAAITPIIIVYLLFFFSQTGYFLSAFSGIRPEGITYAEYARRGFFELCAVSIINLVIILLALFLSKKESKKSSCAVRGYVVTLSVFTLILISIAISKMLMYIDAYGLTRLRVYSSCFMISLLLLFVFIIIRQVAPKFNLCRNFAIVAVVMFAVFVFADVDAVIAKYNVHSYQTGKLKFIDIDAMYELSDSAVKYVVPLMEDENPKVSNAAKDYVSQQKWELEHRFDKFVNFNFTTYSAAKAVGAECTKE